MEKTRLIVTTVILIIYLFLIFPVPSIVISVVAIVCYFAFSKGTTRNNINRGRTERRQNALLKAKIYLGYYSDIWHSLRLANDFCYLTLGADGQTITGFEKNSEILRTFKVLRSKVHDMEEVWNMFCLDFTFNTTYDRLKENCSLFKLVIEENIVEKPNKPKIKPEEKVKITKLTDVNNAQEEELTALPGVSVIMAKKTIKRREEIGGFKSTQDFFDFLKIKPNLQEQLKDVICTNEMKGWKKVERFEERNVDL